MDRLQPGDPSQIGPFRLLGRLGEGGMGRVFLGASLGGRKVAIKIIHPHYANDAEFRWRFAREVAAARQVGGFHTALVVDADPGADPPWMATAYIAGPSLADAVAQRGSLDHAGVRELGAALSEGLAAIHACGIIHRDLKPGNVILADDGPRIIDFGIAKGVDATGLTASNAVIGSLRFMSPEQLNGQELTPQSDVFALGTILAYAATGHDPFRAATVPAVINHILNEPPDLDPLAGELRGIISECLAKEPASRPGLGDLLARFAHPESHDLTVISVPEPVSAVPAPETAPAGSRNPDQEAPTPPALSRTGTINVIGGNRHQHLGSRTAQGGDAAAPARKLATQKRRGRAGLIVAAVIAVAAAALLAVFTLDNHPEATLTGTDTHPGGAPSPRSWSLARTLSDPTDTSALSVAFSPGGSTLAVGDQDDNVYLWNVTTGQITATITDPSNFKDGADAVAFSPNGNTVAVGDLDDSTYLWSVSAGRITATLSDTSTVESAVDSVAFSPKGSTLAVGDTDDTAYVWNPATSQVSDTFQDPSGYPQGGIDSVAFSPNGSIIAVGDLDGHVYLWSVTKGAITATLADPASDGVDSVHSVAFSPNGRILAAGDQEGHTYLWNVTSRTIAATLTAPGNAGAESVAFSPDGATLATGNGYGGTYLWSVATRTIIATLTTGGSRDVDSVAFSPDGTTLAAADADGSTYIWKNDAKS